MGTVRFGRSGRLGFPQGAHRGEKGGAGGHEGVGCVDTHLHLTRIFLPRRSLSTTSIMCAVRARGTVRTMRVEVCPEGGHLHFLS